MYLANILVYILMKYIFYLEFIRYTYLMVFKLLKKTVICLIVIIYLIYCYIIFHGINLLYMTVMLFRYICSILS